MIADSAGLELYSVDEGYLRLAQNDEKKIGTHEEIVIKAVSTDPHHKDKEECTEKFTVYFV